MPPNTRLNPLLCYSLLPNSLFLLWPLRDKLHHHSPLFKSDILGPLRFFLSSIPSLDGLNSHLYHISPGLLQQPLSSVLLFPRFSTGEKAIHSHTIAREVSAHPFPGTPLPVVQTSGAKCLSASSSLPPAEAVTQARYSFISVSLGSSMVSGTLSVLNTWSLIEEMNEGDKSAKVIPSHFQQNSSRRCRFVSRGWHSQSSVEAHPDI